MLPSALEISVSRLKLLLDFCQKRCESLLELRLRLDHVLLYVSAVGITHLKDPVQWSLGCFPSLRQLCFPVSLFASCCFSANRTVMRTTFCKILRIYWIPSYLSPSVTLLQKSNILYWRRRWSSPTTLCQREHAVLYLERVWIPCTWSHSVNLSTTK